MKRPLMIIGFSLFVSLAVFSYLRTVVLVSLAITFGVIALGLVFIAKKYKLHNIVLLFFGALLASLLLLCSDYFYLKPAKNFDGTILQGEGYVKRVDNASYILKCEIDGKYYNIYVEDYSAETVRLGDKYEFSAVVNHTDSLESSYLRSKCRAYNCVLFTEEISTKYNNEITTQYWFEEELFKFKNFLLDRQEEIFADFSVDFIRAITLGDRLGLDEETTVAFKRAGLSHVLVISGMHLSIISGIVFFLLKKSGVRKAAIFALFTTVFYMALLGFPPSITRAGIMNIIMYLGIVFQKDYDALTSVSAACIIMCLLNPYCAADISLQLSVVCTVGILTILPPARKFVWQALGKSNRFTRLVMWLSDIFIICFSANLVLIPFYVFLFGTVSIAAPISNLISSILMPFILANSIFATILSTIPFVSGAACVPAFLADVSSFVFIKITKWISDFKYSSVSTQYTFMVIFVVACCALFGYAIYTKKGKIQFQAFVLSIIVLFASIFCYNINNTSKISVKVLPTYTYGCVVISENDHTTAVYRTTDDENLYILDDKLSDAGIFSIDTLIVPEYEDCAEVVNLVIDYDVSTLIIDNSKPDSTLERKLDEHGVEVISIYENREIDIGDRVTIKFDINDDGRSALIDVDGVIFHMPFGKVDMLDNYDFYKETDIALVGETQPYGLSYMNLSYIVFTNYNTEKLMYKNTAYLSENYAFTDDVITFMIEDSAFYITKEWGRVW